MTALHIMKKILKISKIFSRTPGPRYIREGDYSGELFRNSLLAPAIEQAIKDNDIVKIDLDGTAGYGTSFLEESFGGLIRENQLNYNSIVKHVEFVSDEESYLSEDILQYLGDANERLTK